MKKNTTKILMAALALFMAIGIATGTTFAWFAMQTNVTATGLEIKAKSNSAFLIIGADTLTTADALQAQTPAANLITEDLSVGGQVTVYPSKAFGVANASKDPASVGSATAIDTKAKAANVGNWYTANSSDPTVWGSTDGKTISAHVLNDTVDDTYEFSKYVIKKSVNLTLADGSTKANNLTVKATFSEVFNYTKTKDTALQSKTYYTESAGVYTAVDAGDLDVANIGTYYEKSNNISAVKVLVVSDNDQIALFSGSESGITTTGVTKNLYGATNANLTDTTVHHVDIYVYFDGTEDAVYTNNAINLSGAGIDLEFNVAVNES